MPVPERRIPLFGFFQDKLAPRAERKRLAKYAMEVGAHIFKERQENYFSATELSGRVYGAAEGELDGYSDRIWCGYFRRKKELAEQQQTK